MSIKAEDFIAALSQLTTTELKLPIIVALDDNHEFLTMTVSNSFDYPMVKLLSSKESPSGRIQVIRI